LSLKIPRQKAYKRQIWSYKDTDFSDFRNGLRAAEWDTCFATNNVDEATQRWTDMFLHIANNTIPNKEVIIRPDSSPWYNGYLRRLCRDKDRKAKIVARQSTEENKRQYKEARVKYLREVGRLEYEYSNSKYSTLTQTAKKNKKKWWRLAKEVLGDSRSTQIPAINDDGTILTDDKDKANAFNKTYLASSDLNDQGKELH
jgi:hypothetical protein